MFLAVQEAAIAALTEDALVDDALETTNTRIAAICFTICSTTIGEFTVTNRGPACICGHACRAGYTSAQCVGEGLLETGVSLAPGTTFGPGGEGYMRVSVGQTTDRVIEAVRRMRTLKF